MTVEEIKKDIEKLGSIRRTCPKCHKRIRVKPDRVTCPECRGKYFQKEKKVETKQATVEVSVKGLHTIVVSPKADKKSVEPKKLESIEGCFYIKSSRGADAKAILVENGIQVLKGSVLATGFALSTPEVIRQKIDELQESGVIDNLQFTKDFTFKSSSTAAAVVQGRSANGLRDWKNAEGKSIKEVREEQLK